MKKVYQDCLTHKKRIIEQIVQNETLQVEELSSYTYQLGELLDQMQQVALHYPFRSRKKEILFYEKDVPEVLTYYWYARELSLVLCTLPFQQDRQKTYIEEVAILYASYKSNHFDLYCCYCAKAYDLESERMRMYLRRAENKSTWKFFDSETLFLYPIYFRVLDLVWTRLNCRENTTQMHPMQPILVWKATKVELVLLVYALYKYTVKQNDKATVRDWARAFEQLFGVDISKNYYQILNEYKKKKNIENNLFLKMNQILVDKFNDI